MLPPLFPLYKKGQNYQWILRDQRSTYKLLNRVFFRWCKFISHPENATIRKFIFRPFVFWYSLIILAFFVHHIIALFILRWFWNYSENFLIRVFFFGRTSFFLLEVTFRFEICKCMNLFKASSLVRLAGNEHLGFAIKPFWKWSEFKVQKYHGRKGMKK